MNCSPLLQADLYAEPGLGDWPSTTEVTGDPTSAGFFSWGFFSWGNAGYTFNDGQFYVFFMEAGDST